jgi:hypothetical protein
MMNTKQAEIVMISACFHVARCPQNPVGFTPREGSVPSSGTNPALRSVSAPQVELRHAAFGASHLGLAGTIPTSGTKSP